MRKFKIRIAEPADFSPEVVLKLEKHFFVDTTQGSQDQISSMLLEYDVLWIRLGFRIKASDIPTNPVCKIIATPVTGLDHIDLSACEKAGIKVISLKGEVDFLKTIRATAEHAILLTLMLLRRTVPAIESVRDGIWNRDLFRGHEIFGKTVGIIGLGRLGEIVGSYYLAMGARVLGFDKHTQAYAEITRMDRLEDIARESDIISVHLALDNSTENLINESFFQQVKKDCMLINTSRGGIVDEKSLLNALQSKKIKGAALDVLKNERSAMEGNPLIAYMRDHDNLIITPHMGGNTYESFYKTENFIADRIISFFNV